MKKYLFINFLILTGILFAQEETIEPNPYEILLNKVQQNIQVEERYDLQRIQSAQAKVNELKRIKTQLTKDLQAAVRLSDKLSADFDANEKVLSELEEKLTLKLGNLGEMFGVVRQVAGQTKGEFENSISNIQYPERIDVLQNLSEKKKLPSVPQIKELWFELIKEIGYSAEVISFNTEILNADGSSSNLDVVRLGLFAIASDGDLLKHIPETNQIENLPSQPSGVDHGGLEDIQNESSGTFDVTVDPTRGSLIDKLIQSPSFIERINQGGLVGYFIILLGLFGLALGGERIVFLRKEWAELENTQANNAGQNILSELFKTMEENAKLDFESLQMLLDEKVQAYIPKIESRVAAIKLIATVAPLLGLLGTVIGMIETFQSIQIFGTGDPKLMAGGISQALVTTMLGLIVAAPLLFLHSYADSFVAKISDFLDEKSSGLIATKIN
ncbi:MAG: MotA/TolQ/ExbB proton channel family protein [Gammaproteobacteria bacterium]|jgi:biopolymer transport protein ExbB